jgi:hypothetical protein
MRALPILGLLAGCTGKTTDSATAADTGGPWAPPDYAAMVEIDEGVWGSVVRLSGDWSTGDGDQNPLSVSVRVYPLLQDADLERVSDRPGTTGLLKEPTAAAVAETTADADGFYEIEVPAGPYTVLVQDLGDWYCGSYSETGVCPVTVLESDITQFDVRMSYDATY